MSIIYIIVKVLTLPGAVLHAFLEATVNFQVCSGMELMVWLNPGNFSCLRIVLALLDEHRFALSMTGPKFFILFYFLTL